MRAHDEPVTANPADGDAAAVRFALFGGLRAWRGELELPTGPPRQRALLQLLLIAAGEPVSLGEILAALWVDEPAASATNQVHRHVGELRRRFEPDLGRREVGRRLLPSGSGYRLVVDATTLDVVRFRELFRQGLTLAETSPGAAAAVLAQALDVARAAPGDESVRNMPRFVAAEDERVHAAIRAAEIALLAGLPGEVLPRLREVAGAHPFHEVLQARMMDCLTASGRTVEALALFEQTRTRLRDELGIDAGAELAEAQSRALTAPVATVDVAATPVGSAGTPPPAQLPAPPAGFAGRKTVLAALHGESGSESPLVLITGMAGVGKTTLALHYAHEIADAYPDGQLYLNLRGFDGAAPPTDPLHALRDMLEGLGIPSRGQPESVDARSGLLRSILSQKRILIVLDNAHDYQQVGPLLPGAGASRAIVTSRHQMPGMTAFHHVRPIQLEPFDDEEVVGFLSERLPLSRTDEWDAMIHLGQTCRGLPLALAIVAARAAANPAFPLDLLVREFSQEQTQLSAFNAGSAELDLGTVFSWSYRGLSEDAAHAFAVLSAHPGPEISTAAAVSMSALDPRRAREVLTELTLANVLRESRPGRFAFHDLVREYALGLLAERAREASARLVNHYLRSTRHAILTFGRPPIAPIDQTMNGIVAEGFAGQREAIDWYVEERHVLHAVCRLAMQWGDYRSALILMLDWRPMSQAVDPIKDMLPIMTLALEAAAHVDEPVLIAECYREVAAKFARAGEPERARKYYDLAATTFAEIGDKMGQGNVYRNIALTLEADPQESVTLLRTSVSIARELDNRPVLAASLGALGHVLLRGSGDVSGALEAYTEQLAIARGEHVVTEEVQARVGIVVALAAGHQHEAAAREAERALALLKHRHWPMDELDLLRSYGEVLVALGEDAKAVEVWQRFLEFATPELVEEGLYRPVQPNGDEVIAEVRAKVNALTSTQQSSTRA